MCFKRQFHRQMRLIQLALLLFTLCRIFLFSLALRNTSPFSELEMFLIQVVEKLKTHILCSVTFFFKNRAFCETMSKVLVASERPQMTIWRRVAYWISKAIRAQVYTSAPHSHPHKHTHTHKYIILIAFPRLQRFRERAFVLRYTYLACLAWKYVNLKSYNIKLLKSRSFCG
jgi:hypothetical protein